jgi:hypothetical protein
MWWMRWMTMDVEDNMESVDNEVDDEMDMVDKLMKWKMTRQ